MTGHVTLEREGEVGVVIVDHPPVNALSAAVRDGIHRCVTTALADPDLAAIVLLCAGPTYVAGGDITALGTKPGGAPMTVINHLLESSPKPVIVALHGAAMGGGLEMALA